MLEKTALGLQNVRHKLRTAILRHPILWLFGAAAVLVFTYWQLIQTLPFGSVGRSLTDAIFGGMLASLGAYALIQSFVLHRSAYSLQHWLHFGRRRVWVVPTCIPHRDEDGSESRYPFKYYAIPPFDAQAAGILTAVLRKADLRFPMRRMHLAHIFDERVIRDNLVIVCLPVRNQFSRLILGLYYQIYVTGENYDKIMDPSNWEKFIKDVSCSENYYGLRRAATKPDSLPEWQMLDHGEARANQWKTSDINRFGFEDAHRPGKHPTDYAIIVKGPNPFNPNAGVLVVAGIHGIGTYGAALYVYQNSEHLLSLLGGEGPQAHLLRIKYQLPPGSQDYLRAEILPPVTIESSVELQRPEGAPIPEN